MKTGFTRAMGQKRKYRALKLLLPLLAFALLLGFGPQAGVSYAQPGEDGTSTPAQTTSDPATTTTSPAPAGAPAPSTGESATPANPKPQPSPAKAPGAPAPDPAADTFDLTKFLTDDATLSYGGAELKKDEEGKYKVHPDTPYQLKLGFKEVPGDAGQIPCAKELVYALPGALQAFPIEKPLEFTIDAQGENVGGNIFWVTKDNKIHVKLADNQKLKESQQAKFFVTLDVKFAKDAAKIDLNDASTLR